MNVKLVPLWWVIISIIIRGYSLLEIKNASVEAINNAINEGKGLCMLLPQKTTFTGCKAVISGLKNFRRTCNITDYFEKEVLL